MSVVVEIARLAGFWLIVSVGGFLLHLLTGVLSVGHEEVQRQGREVFEEYGYRWMAVHILTAGFVPRGDYDE